MTCRTYSPAVRVGNWNEDIQLEEDTLKDFLERRENGQLLIQQHAGKMNTAYAKIDLSIARNGVVSFGDTVMLRHLTKRDGKSVETVLSCDVPDNAGKAAASASPSVAPCARNAFVVTSCDGSSDGSPLKYGQPFNLRLKESGYYLSSDKQTFMKAAKKSRNQEVSFVNDASWQTQWTVKSFDPQTRMEMEFTPVQANAKIILAHTRTNQNLSREKYVIGTGFGREFEVSGNTDLDSHKAEAECNHWMLVCSVPGSDVMNVPDEVAPGSASVNTNEHQTS